MAAGGKKQRKKTIFEGIRKPTAPPSRKIGEKKPEEVVHPAGRNVKHKGRNPSDADI